MVLSPLRHFTMSNTLLDAERYHYLHPDSITTLNLKVGTAKFFWTMYQWKKYHPMMIIFVIAINGYYMVLDGIGWTNTFKNNINAFWIGFWQWYLVIDLVNYLNWYLVLKYFIYSSISIFIQRHLVGYFIRYFLRYLLQDFVGCWMRYFIFSQVFAALTNYDPLCCGHIAQK